jgi:hypothetical protein
MHPNTEAAMKRGSRRIAAMLIVGVLYVAIPGAQSLADGTETLAPPQGITIASGTGIIAAGVGLENKDPLIEKKIEFSIPVGATVKQVLIYWEGQTPLNGDIDVTFNVNGVPVPAVDPGGTSADSNRIAEPIEFFTLGTGERLFSLAYRADITPLGVVVPGNNSILVTGLDGFGYVNDGAGVLVIYEEPSKPASLIQLRDGNDLAFVNFAPPKNATVPQVFTFPAASQTRVATLSLFFSSGSGELSGQGPLRPSSIEVTVGGVTTTHSNLLESNSGEEWDTHNLLVTIPAGETSLKVEAFSRNDANPGSLDPLPASFFWLAAGLSVPEVPPRVGEGCTPGYWKQPHHFGNWPAPYTPTTKFSDVFENAFPNKTLLDVLRQGGGSLIALGRHTVAALLNGASDKVGYGLTAEEVIQLFNDAYPGTKPGTREDFKTLHTMFANLNEQYCPLGRAEPNEGKNAHGNVDMTKPGLLQNFPNPFNPETEITFVIPEGAPASIRIYNMLGQVVRTLTDGYWEAGLHTIRWDGNGDRGNELTSGIYIYKLQAGSFVETRKMTLMR